MPDHREAIEALEEALAAGVRSVSIEGTTHTYGSPEEIRQAIAYFRQRDTATAATARRRPFNRLRLF